MAVVVYIGRVQINEMGERSAVGPQSGESVGQSDPGLRRPTPPPTAGRKPAARPPFKAVYSTNLFDAPEARAAGLPQPKIGRGAGQSPAQRAQRAALGIVVQSAESVDAGLDSLTAADITALAEFFLTLDRWDREAHAKPSL